MAMHTLPALDFTPGVGDLAFTRRQRSLLTLVHELGRETLYLPGEKDD